jgi:hypothetical protein
MFDKIDQTISMSDSAKKASIERDEAFVGNEFKLFKEENQSLCLVVDDKMKCLLSLLIKLEEARENDKREMENMREFLNQWVS